MYDSLENGEFEEASKQLDKILLLRNTFIKVGIKRGFTYAMNFLGYEGNFAPDYMVLEKNNAKEVVRECMIQLEMI